MHSFQGGQGKVGHQLNHAMNKLGILLTPGESNNDQVNNVTETRTRMEQTETRLEQLQLHATANPGNELLDFQKEYLEAKLPYEQRLEAQAQRMQQQVDMILQQQQQIQQLIQKMDLQPQ
jgi:transcription termination factor NusB